MGVGLFTTICVALGVFLTIAVITLLVRKLLMKTDVNYNGVFVLIVLILGLVSLVCSLIACGDSIIIEIIPMTSDKIAKLENNITISLLVGFASILFNYIILKIIEKKYKKETIKYKSRWDLDKFK